MSCIHDQKTICYNSDTPQTDLRFNEISIKKNNKKTAGFFVEIDKLILKFIWNSRDQTSQTNFEKEKQCWRIYIFQFQNLLQSYSN